MGIFDKDLLHHPVEYCLVAVQTGDIERRAVAVVSRVDIHAVLEQPLGNSQVAVVAGYGMCVSLYASM